MMTIIMYILYYCFIHYFIHYFICKIYLIVTCTNTLNKRKCQYRIDNWKIYGHGDAHTINIFNSRDELCTLNFLSFSVSTMIISWQIVAVVHSVVTICTLLYYYIKNKELKNANRNCCKHQGPYNHCKVGCARVNNI